MKCTRTLRTYWGLKYLDINGRTLKQQRIENTTGNIDIQNLNNGIYILKIKIDGKILVRKIVKQ